MNCSEAPKASHFKPGERQAEAIQLARRIADGLKQTAGNLWDQLDALDRAIAIIQSTDDCADLVAIRTRIERLHELRRAMELASWAGISIPNALNDAWNRLP